MVAMVMKVMIRVTANPEGGDSDGDQTMWQQRGQQHICHAPHADSMPGIIFSALQILTHLSLTIMTYYHHPWLTTVESETHEDA